MQKKKIIAIAAVSVDGIISINSEIPWNIPEDMKHFRRKTMGNLVVVGYNTYLTLPPKAFEGREYLVIMGDNKKIETPTNTNVTQVNTREEALAFIRSCEHETIYIAGGEITYNTFIEFCDEVILTLVNKTYPNGTKRFPIDELYSNFIEYESTDWLKSESSIQYKIIRYGEEIF